jgi:dTDP-glucose pyrophosphorylase
VVISSERAPAPSIVVLAAGVGSRFGGLKQLVEVGADGAVLMDILLRRAAAAGIERAVIVVGPTTEDLVRSHLNATGAGGLTVDLAVQRLLPGRSRPLGTADAVLAARDAIDGSFIVVNADDLYPASAFSLLADHLRDGPPDEHAMVAFRVAHTLTGNGPESRALIEVDQSGALVSIREGAVVDRSGRLHFETAASAQPLRGDEPISMNIWAFRASVFGALADPSRGVVGVCDPRAVRPRSDISA